MGSVLSGLMVCIEDDSRMLRAASWRLPWSRPQPGKFSSFQNEAAALPVREGGGKASGSDGQPLRSPSAERFHCVTLSAIIRVDFIAAWLSWA